MSTYLYLMCMDHNPPLCADGESGQHMSDLPEILEDLTNRDVIAAAIGLDIFGYGSHLRSNSARFLHTHPKCRIGVRDEYGEWHHNGPKEES